MNEINWQKTILSTRRQLTMTSLAYYTGVKYQTIKRLACGELREPKPADAIALLKWVNGAKTKECTSPHHMGDRALPLSRFHKKKGAKDGLHNQCDECVNGRYRRKPNKMISNFLSRALL